MKPNFALDFRNEAITLLHRTARGWQEVGQVSLDAPDLAAALSYLRTTALELSPKGVTTKLVIPNTQILYTQVATTAPDAARRRKQVARALEGVTPYAVADLAFDISGSGPTVDVAVIAKETLAEAEAFATEHRFNPVSFVGVPDGGSFGSEPWFGPTGCAAAHLADGQRVERDQSPVNVPGREPAPVATEPTPEAAPEPAFAPGPVAETGDAAPAFAGSLLAEPATVEILQSVEIAETEPAVFEPAPVTPPETEPDIAPVAVSDTPVQPETPQPVPPQADLERPGAGLEPEEILARLFDAEPALPSLLPSATITPADEAPMALDVPDDLPDDLPDDRPAVQTSAGVLDASIPDDLPPVPATSVMVAFGSRRALEAAAKEAAAKEAAAKAGNFKAGTPRPGLGKPPVIGGLSATRTVPQAKVTPLAPRPSQPGVVRLPQRPGMTVPGFAEQDAARPATKPAGKPSAAGKALRGLGALVTSPGIAGAKERRPVAQVVTPPNRPSSAASAAAATLTKPTAKPYSGGLGNRNLERSKPRYLGLILTGILLVFLVLVAAWSTFFLETRNIATPDPNAVVGDAQTGTTDLGTTETFASDSGTSDAAALPSVDDEMLADMQDPADNTVSPDPATDMAPDAAAVAEAVAVPVAEPAPLTALDTAAAAATPLLATPQDEFLLATMDEPPSMPDALSLPQPLARNDAPPGPAVPPPPFGTVYQFDAAGLIVPMPEGILTPEGVLLFAGRPDREPPPRPASVTVAAGAAAAVAAEVSAATAPETDPATDPPSAFADPALAGARPRARPAGLVVPTTQNAEDDASLAPASGSRFASLRPRAKPAALVAAAANPPDTPVAGLGAQAASLTAQANATAAATANLATSGPQSPLILAVSRKPAARPKDMSRAVEEAVAIASRQSTPTAPTPPVSEPTAKTEPEADDEPEVASAMPRLPTKTSVATQATYVNAINLSKVNLIGVYGSAADRYALIRQTNGRYKKVKVGDSFDGGKVAAITTSEVRYQKSGKMVTLSLPKS